MINKFWLAFLVLYLYKMFTKAVEQWAPNHSVCGQPVSLVCHSPPSSPPTTIIDRYQTYKISFVFNFVNNILVPRIRLISLKFKYNLLSYLLLPRYNASSALQQISSTFANAFADIFAARRATSMAFFWPNSPAGSDQPGLHTQLNVYINTVYLYSQVPQLYCRGWGTWLISKERLHVMFVA